MVSFLKLSLENEGSDLQEVNDNLSVIEEQIAATAEAEANKQELQNADAVASEHIGLTTKLLQQTTSQSNYSQESANLLCVILAAQLESVGCKVRNVDMQSYDNNQLHQLTLEGAGDWMNHAWQSSVLTFKHEWNAVADFFRNQNSAIGKYSSKLDSTEREFNSKKSEFKTGGSEVSLDQLWYFFRTDKGAAKNLFTEIVSDVAASKFVLNDYTSAVIDEMKKIASIAKGANFKDEKGMATFIKQIEGIKTPEELFGKKYANGKPLFNVTGFEPTSHKHHRAVTVGDYTATKMAALASAPILKESGSWAHIGKKVASKLPYAPFATFAAATKVDFNSGDINSVITNGQKYLENIGNYHDMERKAESAAADMFDSLGKFIKNPYTNTSSHIVFTQIAAIMSNLQHALINPAMGEVARSLRGAKYCNYLALRMIYNLS